jgi:poly-gamma-glutamate synthesis protein (capsule biosynthesis protein)
MFGVALAVSSCQTSTGSSIDAIPPATAVGSTTTSSTTSTIIPTTTTEQATTTTAGRDWLVIQGVGDVNLDGDVIPALRREGYAHAWSGLGGLFLADDVTVVNLECSPSPDGPPEPKEFVFGCDPEAFPAMLDAGVDVVNLGNNHSQDYGKPAMLAGRGVLEDMGLHPVGAGSDDVAAGAPALFDVKGWKVAVLGFGGVFPHPGWFATPERAGMRDGDTIETMVEAVRAAAEVADVVVVTVHWGVELDTQPRQDDRERAEAMIASGADVIFGHHPHRLQPLEVVMGRPVAWSLGNFVWPSLSPAGSTTAVARVVFSPDGEVSACLVPAYIESPGHPVLTGDAECGPE